MKTSYNTYIVAAISIIVLAFGCRKDKLKYDVPTTYNFENVNFSGQTQRMNMLEEMASYMETARNSGTTLDAQRLRDMYENQNNPFSFSSTKQLKDKVFLADQTLLEGYLDSLAAASQSTSQAANGVAGIASSNDGTEHFLLDANGFDLTELFEKGIMGSVFYYQTIGHYLTDDETGESVDNETVTAGEGTPLQHHWDEAFGYFGVGINFPSDLSGIRYWGKACNDRNALLGASSIIMNAFIKGRAAINNDDHETKSAQIDLIRDNWELVIAATAIHELNEAKEHLGDDALRNHEISEAIGYVRALKYNQVKKITDSQINSIIDGFGNNLYSVTLQMIENARSTLSTIYQLDTVKDQL